MNNDDLIERLAELKEVLHSDYQDDVINEAIAALSPVLPEDVQTMSADLRHEITNIVPGGDGSARYSWPTVAMNQELMQQQAANLIEQLARENEEYKRIGAEKLLKQIAEYEKALDDAIYRMEQIGGSYSAKLVKNNLERIRGMK